MERTIYGNTGLDISRLCVGTGYYGDTYKDPEDGGRLLQQAFEGGVTFWDTAESYNSHPHVAAGLRRVGRKNVVLQTKTGEADYAKAAERINVALQDLGTDYLDLFLVHWPNPDYPLKAIIDAFLAVQAAGKTRHIGVSNFPIKLLEEALRYAGGHILCNQVEYHPYLSLKTLKAKADELGISITAWSPLAQGKVAQDPVLIDIGRAHGKTPGQVTLRWLIQQGVIAIPRTSNPKRIEENFDILDFSLSDAEMTEIHTLARPDGRIGDWLDKAYRWDAA